MKRLYQRDKAQSRKTGRAEGERRRAEAMLLLEARRETFILRGRRALLEVLETGAANATADDVRERVDLPAGVDPTCMGAVPGYLARAGIIAPDGFVKSCRREAHARPVRCWRLADREAAAAWLAAHPAPAAEESADLFSGEGK